MAFDGKCHNANRGTFNHECGKPATWIATKPNGFESGFCDHCQQHGDERHGFAKWRRVAPRPGDTIVDEEGERALFLRFSDSPAWGFFKYPNIREPQKMPVAGLRIAPAA